MTGQGRGHGHRRGARLALALVAGALCGVLVYCGRDLRGSSSRLIEPIAPEAHADARLPSPAPDGASPRANAHGGAATDWTSGRNEGPVQRSIRGYLVLPDGSRPREGAVLLWEVGTWPSPSDFQVREDRPERAQGILHAAVGADGGFVVEDASPERVYWLVARAPGALVEKPLDGVAISPRPIRVELMNLYGFVLRIRDEAGEPLDVDPKVWGPGSTLVPPEGATRVGAQGWLAALGITNLLEENRSDTGQYLYLSTADQGALEPARFRDSLPGYRLMKESIRIPRVTGSSIPELTLTTSFTAEATGSLEYAFLPSSSTLACVEDRLSGLICLRGGEQDDVQISISGLELAGGGRARGIPVGLYFAHFEAAWGYFETEEVPLTLSRGVNHVQFDLQDAGSLQLRLPAGYDGALDADLVDRRGASFFGSFEHSPYAFPLLPAGDYRILRAWTPTGLKLEEPRAFRIASGVLSETVLF